MSIIDSNARWEDEDKAMQQELERERIFMEGVDDIIRMALKLPPEHPIDEMGRRQFARMLLEVLG